MKCHVAISLFAKITEIFYVVISNFIYKLCRHYAYNYVKMATNRKKAKRGIIF